MNICLRDLPTRIKSTLPSRVPTHAYVDWKISGQQPTQLYKEFPRIHEVGHSKKNDAHLKNYKVHFPLESHQGAKTPSGKTSLLEPPWPFSSTGCSVVRLFRTYKVVRNLRKRKHIQRISNISKVDFFGFV